MPLPDEHWKRFSILDAMLLVTLAGILCGCIVSFGAFGCPLFGVIGGCMLIAVGVLRKQRQYEIAGVCLMLSAGIVIALVSTAVAIGSGRRVEPCTFVIVDEIGQPVASAEVRLRDCGWNDGVPVFPIPTREPVVSARTNDDGKVTIFQEFSFSCRDGIWTSESNLYISPTLWLQVDADGHERLIVRLDSLLGSSYDFEDLPMPVTQVRVKVAPRATPTHLCF
ncbi:MAG: hypothetical protein KDA60_19295 [Planctomycetales bacterium]|nr:hypothetical protein [Planctomycetales bacterium]